MKNWREKKAISKMSLSLGLRTHSEVVQDFSSFSFFHSFSRAVKNAKTLSFQVRFLILNNKIGDIFSSFVRTNGEREATNEGGRSIKASLKTRLSIRNRLERPLACFCFCWIGSNFLENKHTHLFFVVLDPDHTLF